MRKVGLSEARQKLSELVERAGRESIGITKRGKLAAVMGSAQEEVHINELFARTDAIRKRAKKMPGVSLIEEGRM
jgi:prevent-host-death family protein